VGGIFLGYPVHGFVAHIQDNEYVRYAREIRRRKGRADVLTGTATLFSARALRAVEHARSTGQVPPGTGIYGVDALTEDNELTLALKHLGYRCVSPKACTAGTELMPTTARLFNQRLRWQRGALQNLLGYGVTRQTSPYIARQVMTYAAVAFPTFFLTTMIYAWIRAGYIGWTWFWVLVTSFVVFERVWSVKRGGWRSVLIAGLVVPEAVYDLFLHAVYIKALTDAVTHTRGTWENTKPGGSAGSKNGRVYAAAFAVLIGFAVACTAIGVAWLLIAVFVLVGAAFAALRLANLDPCGLLLGTGEPASTTHAVGTSNHQGFGGPDVPVDPLARLGGEGTHHWLSGGPAMRGTQVNSSASARLSRQSTTTWLYESRRLDTRRFSAMWDPSSRRSLKGDQRKIIVPFRKDTKT
jgi:hypothetical protein